MDLILTGGAVLTMDSRRPRAEAVAVQGGKIAAVGAAAEVARLAGPDTRVVHLAGRTLAPGLIDPHNHFSMTALNPVSVDCRVPPHASIQGILEAVEAAAKGTQRGRWIRGWGFSIRMVREKRRITRGELDEVSPDNPVCIVDSSYHACYANSLALKLAGVDRDTPKPWGGWILRDGQGEPNGTLWEAAMNGVHHLCLQAYLEYLGDGAADLIYENCMKHLALGITSVGDAQVMPEGARLYRLADEKKKLPMTIHQLQGGDQFFAAPERVARGETGRGDVSDRLRGGTIKIFMDPVFPSSALVRHHPHRECEHVGERYYTQEEANALVLAAHRNGLQVAIHCLGTWSVEQALNAFERAQREHPRPEPRFRIEHFSLPTLKQIRRAKSLGVVASVQPIFHYTFGEYSVRRAEELGGGVLSNPHRTMLSEGLVVAASSDCPCAPLEPMQALYGMVTRRTRSGGPPTDSEEAVTPLEGLRMYTMGSAYAMSREKEVGSLEKGKRADMIVLSHDPTAANPLFIREIEVEQTYVDGKLVYRR